MIALVALVVGYVLGARSGRKDLDQLGRSLKAWYGTEEFADVVAAARAQFGGTLREVAAMVDGQHEGHEHGNSTDGPFAADGENGENDLVARVRHLVGRG